MQFKQDSDKQGFIHKCTHSNTAITSSYSVRLGSSKKEETLIQKFFSFLFFHPCEYSTFNHAHIWEPFCPSPTSVPGTWYDRNDALEISNININLSPDFMQVCGSAVKRVITCTFLLHSDSNQGPRLTANSSRPKHNPTFTDVIFENEVWATWHCVPGEHRGTSQKNVKQTSLETGNGTNEYHEKKFNTSLVWWPRSKRKILTVWDA